MEKYGFMIGVLVVLIAAVSIVTLKGICLTNEQYDRLKKIVLKWPAIVTLLGVIISVFSVAYGQETVTLISAIGAFLAHILDESDKGFSEGAVIEAEEIEEGDGIDESDYL